jgi:pyruvate/2-oxoglutarate dehydrogenase complex dihydrolipoamide acyltransferase (E2) component
MAAAVSIASGARIHATPYARRLARERGVSLLKIMGTGPNGRITGVDLNSARSADVVEMSPLAAAGDAPAAKADAIGNPSAIATSIEFQAVEALLGQIHALRSDISRQDICLKAAALALDLAAPGVGSTDILLLTAPSRRQVLVGVAQASLSSIAALRSRADEGTTDGLAVSFLGHAGVRPVAAQLGGGVRMRLVIGLGDVADCLLSYDPLRISDEAAEGFLVAFREFVETPIRLLV